MTPLPTDGPNTEGTDSALIALLLDITDDGFIIEITCVRTGHHDDGPDGHYGGRAADGWINNTRTHADWMDPDTLHFADALDTAYRSPWSWQLAVVGTANTEANRKACGSKLVPDSGADHLHFGSVHA